MWIDSPLAKKERHAANTNDVIEATDEVHFDSPLCGIVEGLVGEPLGVKIGAQFAVDPHQNVLVERGRDPLPVVVSGLDHARILLQIDADQESAATSAQSGRLSQQGERCLRSEVAESRAGKVDYPPGCSLLACRQAQRPREVGAQRQHLDVRVLLAQRAGRAAQVLARDINGHVTGRIAQPVEEARRVLRLLPLPYSMSRQRGPSSSAIAAACRSMMRSSVRVG